MSELLRSRGGMGGGGWGNENLGIIWSVPHSSTDHISSQKYIIYHTRLSKSIPVVRRRESHKLHCYLQQHFLKSISYSHITLSFLLEIKRQYVHILPCSLENHTQF